MNAFYRLFNAVLTDSLIILFLILVWDIRTKITEIHDVWSKSEKITITYTFMTNITMDPNSADTIQFKTHH